MHSFHPAPIFLPIFPARCIIFPPPLFSVAQRIEWFISLGPSMFLSLTAQTFCKTLLLKHEQRTLVIMAKINDTFATIYLSSPKVIDISNDCKDQRQKCYILKSYVITWIGCLHLICGKDLRSKKYPIMTDRHRKNQHCSNLHDVWTYVIQSNTYSMYHIIDYWYIINILLILDYQYIIGMMIWETCLTGNQAVLPLSPSDQNLKQMSLLSGFYEPYF